MRLSGREARVESCAAADKKRSFGLVIVTAKWGRRFIIERSYC